MSSSNRSGLTFLKVCILGVDSILIARVVDGDCSILFGAGDFGTKVDQEFGLVDEGTLKSLSRW